MMVEEGVKEESEVAVADAPPALDVPVVRAPPSDDMDLRSAMANLVRESPTPFVQIQDKMWVDGGGRPRQRLILASRRMSPELAMGLYRRSKKTLASGTVTRGGETFRWSIREHGNDIIGIEEVE